jgi:hypothetical protein
MDAVALELGLLKGETGMGNHRAATAYSCLSTKKQIAFLLSLSHGLTILARDCYEVGKNGLTRPVRVRILNEVQHRILGFLLALNKNDSQRYPDDVLVRIILEHADDPELQRQLESEFDWLLAKTIAAA